MMLRIIESTAIDWNVRLLIRNIMKYIKLFILFGLLLISCTDNDIDLNNPSYYTTVLKARYGYFTDQIPRTRVNIAVGEYRDSLVWYDTVRTNSEGFAFLDSLSSETFFYGIKLVDSEEYGENNLYQASFNDVEYLEIFDTLRVGVHYFWNFSKYEINLKEDTTTNFMYMLSFVYNNGIRDTLICDFDTTHLPPWFGFSTSKDTFPPMFRSDGENYFVASYDDNLLPIDSLPYIVKIPVTHQYGETEIRYIIELDDD